MRTAQLLDQTRAPRMRMRVHACILRLAIYGVASRGEMHASLTWTSCLEMLIIPSGVEVLLAGVPAVNYV